MAVDHPAPGHTRHRRSATIVDAARRLLVQLRDAQAAQVELHERMLLRHQPWLEDLMHWAHDGEEWHLHGTRLPPDGRRRSVTRDGWCPGVREQR